MSEGLARAYVLGRRDFRESSLIVELLVEDAGRVDAVARGARNRRGVALQPFTPVLVSVRGRGDLKTLAGYESAGVPVGLGERALYCGFYLNELLVRCLTREDPTPGLFESYAGTLDALAVAGPDDLEPALRRFEFRLLELLGYGLNLDHASDTGAALKEGTAYVVPLEGVFETRPSRPHIAAPVATLAAIIRREFDAAEVRALAKRIARAEVDALLGGRTLKSRELFSAPR